MNKSRQPTVAAPQAGRAGSRWLSFMGLMLALLGGCFTVMLWNSWRRAEETRSWIATPAKVLSSQVFPDQETPNSPTKYRVSVRYQYKSGDSIITTGRIHRSDGLKTTREDAEAVREEYTPGQELTCWVNPLDNGYSVLQHDSRAPLYTIWFPLLFVVGGLRMAWGAMRRGA